MPVSMIPNYKTPTYTSWRGMKYRCRKQLKHYEGITFPSEWLSFSKFVEDMGERPEGTELDRIDYTKPYSKENCRWANDKVQSRNRSSAILLTFNGKTQCISAWAEELGVNEWTLRARYCRYGWSVEDTLTKPVRQDSK